jgi:hypothetical protein
MKKIIIATAIALATTSGFASAGPTLQSVTFIDHFVDTTNWNHDSTFPVFDSTLGILKEVDISLDGHFFTTGVASNTGNLTSEVFSLTSSGDLTFTNSSLSINQTLTAPATTSPDFTVAPGASTTFGGLTYTSTLHDVLPAYTTPAQLALFETANLIFGTHAHNTSGVNFISQNGNYLSGPKTDADATVTVTYLYENIDPVMPEPASIALLAAGLFGFAFRRKAA